jgi:nicotinamide riboside kinase
VVTPLNIGIAGTHSTGKTTLARRIEMELRAAGLTVTRTGGLAKRAAELGFPKMTRHTAASTEWIITAGAAAVLEAELTAEVVIVDRTAHDALAYYHAALTGRGEQPDPDDTAHLAALADAHTRRHKLLLATVLDPATPLGEHPRKDPAYTDRVFRTAVDRHLHRLLRDHGVEHRRVSPAEQSAAVDAAVAAAMTALAAA